MPIRPLGPISDLVTDEMPRILRECPETLADTAAKLVSDLTGSILNPALANQRAITQLDLTMLEAGIVFSGFAVPENLTSLVNHCAGNEPPMLSYENLVLLNPSEDLRIFTDGDVGNIEKTFYRQHWLIEGMLLMLVRTVDAAIDHIERGEIDYALANLKGNETLFKSVLAAISMLAGMPKEHFGTFRKYLVVHPTRNLKGPSGAFTGRFPALEFLLRGDSLPPELSADLESNWAYLPVQDRPRLRRILDTSRAGRTLLTLWHAQGQPEVLKPHIEQLGIFFLEFRKAHYRAVGKQLPEALNDSITGTGGEERPGEFLRDRIAHSRTFTTEPKTGE